MYGFGVGDALPIWASRIAAGSPVACRRRHGKRRLTETASVHADTCLAERPTPEAGSLSTVSIEYVAEAACLGVSGHARIGAGTNTEHGHADDGLRRRQGYPERKRQNA